MGNVNVMAVLFDCLFVYLQEYEMNNGGGISPSQPTDVILGLNDA